jgi:competence protein ComEC
LGIAHLLSISGVHFGFVALLFASGLGWLFRRSIWILEACDIRKWVWALALLPALGYLLLSGMPIPAVRTFVMLVVYAGAWWIGRQSDLWSCFWVAAFGILFFDPHSLFDLSFQLSFGAIGSILHFQPTFFSWVEQFPLFQKGGLRAMAQMICVSLIVFLTMTPLTVHVFHLWSPWSFLANLIFVPWIGFLVLPFGLFGIITHFVWSPLAEIFWHIAGFLLSCAQALIEKWSSIPGGIVWGPSLPSLSVFFWYAGLMAFLFANRRRIFYGLGIVSFLVSGLWLGWHREIQLFFKEPQWEITFLNVGQGDSSFIATPQGGGILMDGGTRVPFGYDTGKHVVAPFLWSHPWARLTTMVATHWDIDHIGGLAFILENFPVKELWIPPCPPSSPFAEAFLEGARDRGIVIRVLSRGLSQASGGTMVQVLHPPLDLSSLPSDNDCSLVLRFKTGDYSFLFTGDIEDSGEKLLLEHKETLTSTVLKVPHHGSRSSSSLPFVTAVQPRFAIFSVGYLNRFGFPNFGVVQRYLRVGSQILRTDLDGSVTFRVSGDSLSKKNLH